MVSYEDVMLVAKAGKDLPWASGDTFSVLGSTGTKGDAVGEELQKDWAGTFSIDFKKIAERLAAGGYVKEKEDSMADVFEDLKTVFGIGEEFKNASEFYLDLYHAAEGIRQHDALHRVTDAFYGKAEWLLDGDDQTETQYGSRTTTILGGNEEEQ